MAMKRHTQDQFRRSKDVLRITKYFGFMNFERQRKIQEHFEEMHRGRVRPWREHVSEPPLNNFFKLLAERLPEGARILDIGCGDGWISIRAAKEGHRAWGIDSSKSAIADARAAAKDAGIESEVEFCLGDGLQLPYDDNSFDAIVDRGFFHHILPENRPLYFKNILRVLAAKGLLYLSVFSEKSPFGIGQRFSEKLAHQLFGECFRTIYFSEDLYLVNAPAHLLHFIFEQNG